MRDQYMRTGQGFVLVYSITDPSSFEDCLTIHEQLLRSKDADEVPLVLVGNKCDLEEERSVSREEGENMAEKFGDCKFLESSAKERINVEEIFISLVRLIDKASDPNAVSDDEEEDEDNNNNRKRGRRKWKLGKKCTML